METHGRLTVYLAPGVLSQFAGTVLALSTFRDWMEPRSVLEFPPQVSIGIALVFAGALVLLFGLVRHGSLPPATAWQLILAGAATVTVTDIPWLTGALLSTHHPVIHRTCLQATQIALGIDALMVLVLSVSGLIMLLRRPGPFSPSELIRLQDMRESYRLRHHV